MGNAFSFFRLPVALLEQPALLLPELDSDPEWKPARNEDAGLHLERLLVDLGEDAVASEYLRALGARMTFHSDSVGDFFTRLDAILRAHGDLGLLGFLCQVPSRSDVLAHLERLPARARRFGRANTAVCLAPAEVRALAAALQGAKQDGFRQVPRHLRGEDVALHEALGATGPQEGDIDLWLFSGADPGELNPDDLPEDRGAPAIPRRPSFLDRLFRRA